MHMHAELQAKGSVTRPYPKLKLIAMRMLECEGATIGTTAVMPVTRVALT